MHVTSLDLERLRALLEERRAELADAIAGLNHDGPLTDEAGGFVSARADDHHLADTATDTYARELDEGLAGDAERLLGEIEAALARLETGTFGLCRVCGREIGAERLEAVPYATLCIGDKRLEERG